MVDPRSEGAFKVSDEGARGKVYSAHSYGVVISSFSLSAVQSDLLRSRLCTVVRVMVDVSKLLRAPEGDMFGKCNAHASICLPLAGLQRVCHNQEQRLAVNCRRCAELSLVNGSYIPP